MKDPLRKIVVHLDFIRSESNNPSAVIASSISYVGYVGVLTGVRPGLSLSLNFRPLHNAVSRSEQFRFYFHHLLVLLGLRPSISSILRSYLFRASAEHQVKDLAAISTELAPRHTTAAYLTFSDGVSTITMEKDYKTSITRQSSTFIVATNHDREEAVSQPKVTTPASTDIAMTARVAALKDLLDESKDRMDCISNKWRKEVRKVNKNSHSESVEDAVAISGNEVIRWVSAWPTTNETTHYAVVMDPELGHVVWSHSYSEPVVEPAPRILGGS